MLQAEVDYRWQCRRGMLELDLLLNNFVDKKVDELTRNKKNPLNYCFPILTRHCSTYYWEIPCPVTLLSLFLFSKYNQRLLIKSNQ